MKIEIKQPNKVIMINLLSKWFYILGMFVVGVFVGGLVLLFSLEEGGEASTAGVALGVVIAFLLPLSYMVFSFMDIKKFADSNSIELKKDSLDFHSNNVMSRRNNSLPVSQINSVGVAQNAIMKMAGLAVVIVTLDNGDTVSSWGFNYEEAKELADKFAKDYRVKVSSN